MKLSKEELESVVEMLLPEVKKISQKFFIAGGNSDDLCQEGLIGLVDGIERYDENRGGIESESFKAFVLMCAKRQILDAIKKANSKKNMALNTSISLSAEDVEALGESGMELIHPLTPEEIVMELFEKEETATTISINLSSFEQEVLNLYLEGMKQSEIAEKLDKSIKSIDNTLQRIKNKIKGKN
ncbi:MAG: sigma-70 family RNA polymerase sigma factor [Clostridia bacterium]|nr:sigma-70 family RNA polymerase sigma factor [Clostridia bacterium]